MIKLNKIIKYLIYSDLIFYTGWGLISPIFALFLVEGLKLTALAVGMSSAVNLIVRSLLRIPFGIAVDRHHNQRKAFNYMFFGLLIAAFVPIGYLYASTPMHIYVLQAILGASLSMSTAGWTMLFSRHMDKGKESTEWGVDAVAVGIGPGIAGILGGWAVTYFSFGFVFASVAFIGVVGVLLLLFIKKDIVRDKKTNTPSQSIALSYELRRMKKARFH